MIRLFIALKINEKTQDKFDTVIKDFQTKGGKVKWVDAKNLHITLKFLGNTDPKNVDLIISQLQKAISKFQSIESDFFLLGGFPNLRKPKVIWVDIEKNKALVNEVANTINDSLTEIGIEKNDKEFRPHVTLGRVKSYEGLDDLSDYISQYVFERTETVFDKILLIQSTLTQKGPIYKTLHEIQLTERFGD